MTKHNLTVEAIKPRCGQILTQTTWWFNRTLEGHGGAESPLNPYEINLLIAMRIVRKMTLEQVCEHTGISKNERTSLVLSLFKKGLILPHPFQNEQGIALTSKGEAYLKQAMAAIEKTEKQALEGFSEKEKRMLLDFFDRIKANCAPTL